MNPRTVSVTEAPTVRPRLDEAALWRRVRMGDRQAADELAASTYRLVFASLIKLSGDEDLAADLTQETYRKAWKSLGRFNERSKFSTWLYRIAYNTFLNHLRRPHRVVALDEFKASKLEAPITPADSRAIAYQEAEEMRRAVLSLPDELRFAISARYWADLPVREIARLQGISAVGVRKRLKRAYRHLERDLGERLS